jgi:hypothetical protein
MRIKPGFSSLSCFGLAALALLSQPQAHAQDNSELLAQPSVRIAQPVSNTALVRLKSNTSPMAQAKFDQGVAAASTETGRLQLLLRPSAAQSESLREYLGGLQDPHSANYHKWLTPQSYGASFGISEQDLETVEAWLQSEGFTVNSVPASRNFITFSGTFGQVAQAFHTSIHSYLINGVRHYSNASDPSIPAALAPVVLGVSPLNDFHAKPMHTQPIGHTVTAQAGHLKVVSDASGSVKPQLTATDSQGDNILLLAPGDAATIYDSPNTLNKAYTGTNAQTGTGVNIGLVGDSDLPLTDYLNYRKLFLNEASPVSPTQVVDGVDPGQVNDGSSAEALIDTELSAGLAPKANIYFYSSADDLFQDGALDAALRAVEDNNVAILSVSFGECEYDLGPSGNQEIDAIWQQAAAQGITVLVSTGDSGSASCDADGLGEASGGLAVSGFASTPYNIGVGGTDFDVLSTAFDTYVGTTAATAGSSANYFDSALKYIPENPWNDSISNNPPGSFTTNMLEGYTDSATGQSSPLITGGGGGASSLAVCEGNEIDEDGNCDSVLTGYPTPSFQTGVSIAGQNPDGTPTGVRYLPDVSLFASAGNLHNASWAICADAAVNEGGTTGTDCEADTNGEFGISAYGGTSTSSPAFAGILAMVVQSLGAGTPRLGLANNVLYNLNKTDGGAGIFHDVTAGNISQPCASGSPNCGTNGFLEGWNAGTGYDLATGLGSVDISKLVSGWDSAKFTATTVTLTANGSPSSLSVVHGTSVKLASTLSPTTATGTVGVVGPTGAAGAAVNEVIPISSGSGSTTVTDLPGGSYAMHAYYQGDVNDSPSSSSPAITVNITPEASTPYLSVSEYDLGSGNQATDPASVPYGYYGFVYVQPENATAASSGVSNGFATGTVTLNNGASTSTQTLNSEGVGSFPLYAVSPGTYSLTAQYSGDKSYNASSTSAAVPLTITQGQTALSVVSSSSAIADSGSTTVVATLATDSAGNLPTGTITLKAGNGASFTGTTTAASLSDGADAIIATFNVSGASLASGSNTLTATYPGDANYSGSTGAVNVTVSGSTGGGGTTPGFNVGSASSTLSVSSSGQSAGPDTITVTPTNGFTGAVAMTCSLPLNIGGGVSPTCSLSASSVTISGATAQQLTLTVNTTALSALQPMHAPGDHMLRRLLAGGGGLALCSVLLFGIPSKRRSWRSMLVVLLAFGVLGAIGCGGTSTSSNNGTQPGTYAVTVTGTSGSTTANTVVSVTVQ